MDKDRQHAADSYKYKTVKSILMKNIIPFVMAVVALSAVSSPAQQNAEKLNADYASDYRLFQGVVSNAMITFNSATNTASNLVLDAALDKLLVDSKDKVSASFTVARIEWLRNQPAKAISILEDVIRKHGQEDFNQGIIQPVNIAGNYWIGTISRQNGDAERAIKAYNDVIVCDSTNPKPAREEDSCHIYLSEIKAEILKQTNAALDELTKVKMAAAPAGSRQISKEDKDIWQSSMDWQVALIKGKQDEWRSHVVGSPYKTFIAMVSIEGGAMVSGVGGCPWHNFSDDNSRILLIYGLKASLKFNKSPLDRSFALFELGQLFESDQPMEAEKYYTELLESDSFYAPEGGIFLADFQKKQGRIQEAKKTYEKIKQRFPGYTKYVDELAKDPAPMKFSM